MEKINKLELFENIDNSWLEVLDNKNLENIIDKLNSQNIKYFPNNNNILKAFKFFKLKQTKLVLLGQDPYHNEKNNIPQATGLSFSVDKQFKIPPSLKNIYKELKLENNNFKIPDHGCLERWAKEENILLLNSALTVIPHKAGTHLKLWEQYTNEIIYYLSKKVKNIIFLLLGNFAQKKIKYIENCKIFKAVHPSPLSANKGFLNSNIFKKINQYLLLSEAYKKLYFVQTNLDPVIIIIIFKQIKVCIDWKIES